MGTAIKHRVSDRVKSSFVIFDIRALWRSALSVRVPGCQKLQMTGLTRSGTGCCIAHPYGNSGGQRVKIVITLAYCPSIAQRDRSISLAQLMMWQDAETASIAQQRRGGAGALSAGGPWYDHCWAESWDWDRASSMQQTQPREEPDGRRTISATHVSSIQ